MTIKQFICYLSVFLQTNKQIISSSAVAKARSALLNATMTRAPSIKVLQRKREDARVMEVFGKLVRNRRECLGLSAETVALQVGVTSTAYAKLERDERTVPLWLFMNIASALGCLAADLTDLLDQELKK